MREGLQRVPSHPTLVKNKAGSDTESGDENVLISVTDDKVAGTHLARNDNHPSDLTDGDGGDLSSESEKIGSVFKRTVLTRTGNGSNRQAREIVQVAEHSLQPGTTSCSDASSSDASSSDASFNDSGSDIDDDSDASDRQTARPCRKRKRHAPTRFRVRERDTASEQCSTNTSRAAKRLKRSPNESWTPHITTQHSHSSSSSSSSSRRAPRHSKHLRKHKQVRDCDTEKSDGEYEVERIVDVRLVLQYRANWLGYEEDPMWHDASNFKNSPSRLRDFHDANPSRPGPPCRLGIWEKCWKRDEDATEHDDDNKPERVRKYG